MTSATKSKAESPVAEAPAPTFKLFFIGELPEDAHGIRAQEHSCGRTGAPTKFTYVNEEDEYPSAMVRKGLGDELIRLDRRPNGPPRYKWAK